MNTNMSSLEKELKKKTRIITKLIAGATVGATIGLVTYMFMKPGKSEKEPSQEYSINEKTGERLFI